MSNSHQFYGTIHHFDGSITRHNLPSLQEGKTWLANVHHRTKLPHKAHLIRVRYFREETQPTDELISVWTKGCLLDSQPHP